MRHASTASIRINSWICCNGLRDETEALANADHDLMRLQHAVSGRRKAYLKAATRLHGTQDGGGGIVRHGHCQHADPGHARRQTARRLRNGQSEARPQRHRPRHFPGRRQPGQPRRPLSDVASAVNFRVSVSRSR